MFANKVSHHLAVYMTTANQDELSKAIDTLTYELNHPSISDVLLALDVTVEQFADDIAENDYIVVDRETAEVLLGEMSSLQTDQLVRIRLKDQDESSVVLMRVIVNGSGDSYSLVPVAL